MRYLSAVSSLSAANALERSVGPNRIRPLAPGEDPASLAGERFAGIIANHATQLPSLRHGLPVVLIVPLNREGLRQFRIVAEAGVDVRLWPGEDKPLTEGVLHELTRPRAPTPAAVIVGHLRGRYSGLAADVVTATAVMGNCRRSMEEVARACQTSASGVRSALRDARLLSVTAMLARMRALHALWGLESGQGNFWSAAGFKTLAELSAHLSQHTGAPLGRWRGPDAFFAMLETVAGALEEADTAATG
jgi:hypothetical protein